MKPVQRPDTYAYLIWNEGMRSLLVYGSYWYCAALAGAVENLLALFEWAQDPRHSAAATEQLYGLMRTQILDIRRDNCIPFLLCTLGALLLSVVRLDGVFSFGMMLFSSDMMSFFVAYVCMSIMASMCGAVRSREVLLRPEDEAGAESTAEAAAYLQTLHMGVRILHVVLPYVERMLYYAIVWTVVKWTLHLVWIAAKLFVTWRADRCRPRVPVPPVEVVAYPSGTSAELLEQKI
jgi:hypothetical protein